MQVIICIIYVYMYILYCAVYNIKLCSRYMYAFRIQFAYSSSLSSSSVDKGGGGDIYIYLIHI